MLLDLIKLGKTPIRLEDGQRHLPASLPARLAGSYYIGACPVDIK